MKKILFVSFLGIFLTFNVAIAAIPETNRMQLGEISDALPAQEMRIFFTQIEPIMRKIFGPPLSNINLKIEANTNGTDHDTGYTDNEQTLVLAGQAKRYQEYKVSDPVRAIDQLYSNMIHELAHGMYYNGNKRVTFNPQWINEGWAKVQEILMAKALGKYNFGTRPFFNYYLDRDTIAGTTNWGSSKQTMNHGLVYDVTSVVHLTLLSAASSSNDNLDFLKTLNNRIYDTVKNTGQTNLTLTHYQDILRPLLINKKIDGISAYDWYFNNPNTLTKGILGNHLGIATEPGEIIAYAFNRVSDGRDIQEKALSGIKVTIKAINYDNKILTEKTVQTDMEGNARIPLPKNGDATIMTVNATTTVDNKPLTANMFYFDAPPQDSILSGVLIDETGKPLPSKYVALLRSDLDFSSKEKGVFTMIVPTATSTVTLDFLSYKQEVTKGPFARMFAMTIPAKYVVEAGRQSDTVINSGTIKNQSAPNQKTPTLVIGIASLLAVAIAILVIFKSPFNRKNK